ncbi:MAG: hypothetical protein HFI44_06780 [Lachnospiraceae bacterium]|nr:hypothetical protein [Lachnospiraceae bacterium]
MKLRRMIVSRDTAIVEWYFKCDYEGNVDSFDGLPLLSLMRIKRFVI